MPPQQMPVAANAAAARQPDPFRQQAAGVNTSDPKVAAQALVSPGTFAGRWHGMATIERQGMCNLYMEINQQPDKTFLGYPAMSCRSMQPFFEPDHKFTSADAQKMLIKPNPATALLVGAFENGAVTFRVDRIATPNPSGCTWSSVVVTPFGQKAVTVQFQDSCGGASFVLERQP